MGTLANKYRPQSFDDVVEQSLVVDMLKSMCSNPEMPNRNFLLVGPAGTGKAQPLTSKVLTTSGYVEMKDVKIGTSVITSNDNVATVSEIFPQGKLDVYEIKLSDGSSIQVADNHLNEIWTKSYSSYIHNTFETKELLERYHNKEDLYIKCVKTSSLENKCDLPLDPYVLGVFVSCGYVGKFYQVYLSCKNIDTVKRVDTLLNDLYGLKLNPVSNKKENRANTRYQVVIDKSKYTDFVDGKLALAKFVNTLKELRCVISRKSRGIPDVYLNHSADVRLEVFKAILDSKFNSGKIISTASLSFANDIIYIARSFGCNSKVVTVTNSKGNIYYSCKIRFDSSFPYLSTLYPSGRLFDTMRKIESIEYVGKQECQCIMVDHPDHTYISDNFIPTHNTTNARIMANVLNDGNGSVIELDAASNNSVESVRQLVQQMKTFPVGSKWKVFVIDECHCFSSSAWQVFLKVLEESPAKSICVFCTTNPEKIPATILSRVQTFQLSKISLDGINKRLIHVLESEKSEGRNITYTEDAVNYIAKLANGGMRDSLTLLDKALAYSNDINSENLSKALGLPNYDDYFTLLGAYAKKNNEVIASIIHKVYNSGVNFVKWFEGFHSFVVNIVKYIFLQDINKTMIPSHYQNKISNYNVNHSTVCLKLANRLLSLNHELKGTQYLQEVALTYLCSTSKSDK